MLRATAIVVLLSALSVVTEAGGSRLRLFWPALTLDTANGERIDSIEIRAVSARFRGITNIPNDWSVDIASPSSAVSTLRAYAGHGATTLRDLSELDGSIVLDGDSDDITCTIKTTNDGREIHLKRKDFTLRP